MEDEATDRALRQLEAILDSHYRSLPFFGRPPSRAAYTLLATFDSMYLLDSYITLGGPEDMKRIQDFRALEEGLSQGLRWILGSKGNVDPVPSKDAPAMDEAYRFIEFAGIYNRIEDFHIMYGKRWVNIVVDLHQKRVQFLLRDDRDGRATMAGREEELA